MTSNKEIIDRILELTGLIENTEANLDQLHDFNRDLGVNFSDPKALERIKQTNIPEKHFLDFLDELSTDQIRLIFSLMYSGRDGEELKSNIDYFKTQRKTEREIMVHTVFEKRPALNTYLKKGLKMLEVQNLDINSF